MRLLERDKVVLLRREHLGEAPPGRSVEEDGREGRSKGSSELVLEDLARTKKGRKRKKLREGDYMNTA